MNPQTATMPTAPRVNDVAAPVQTQAPASSAPVQTAPESEASMSGPSVVTNIPVHAPQSEATPANEDAELDKIMHDVGQELKKEEKQPEKHGLLDFLHHDPKPLVKVNNQVAKTASVAAAPMPVAAPTPAMSAAPEAAAPPAQPHSATQSPTQVAAKPKAKRHIPVFVIFVALCVTGFLVAAAVAAYRQT